MTMQLQLKEHSSFGSSMGCAVAEILPSRLLEITYLACVMFNIQVKDWSVRQPYIDASLLLTTPHNTQLLAFDSLFLLASISAVG